MSPVWSPPRDAHRLPPVPRPRLLPGYLACWGAYFRARDPPPASSVHTSSSGSSSPGDADGQASPSDSTSEYAWCLEDDDDAQPLETCTILTCAANDTVQTIHDRMPVIIPPEHFSAWLDPAGRDVEIAGVVTAIDTSMWLTQALGDDDLDGSRTVAQVVVFLYLMDEETSYLVIVPMGVGTVIEVGLGGWGVVGREWTG